MVQKLLEQIAVSFNQHRSRILFLFCCLTYAAFLGLIWVSNDAICINASIVNNIDIIKNGKKTTVFQCSSPLKAKFDHALEKEIQDINKKVLAIENYLTAQTSHSIDDKSKLTISINHDRLLQFEIIGQQIKIGALLVEEPGNLERALIKHWIRKNVSDQLLVHSLFEESLADLIYFSYSGQLDINDPINAKISKIGQHRWPQVLKSFDEYCESSWKMLEHAENCSKISAQKNSETVHDFIEMSLRPLTTQTLIQAYLELNVFERQRFVDQVPRILQSINLTPDKALQTILDEENPLRKGLRSLRTFANVLTLPQFSEKKEFKKFSVLTSELLEQSGVTDSFAEAFVDYLVEIPETIKTDSTFFKSLKKAAEKNVDIQFAVTDRKNIWILPFGDRLPLKAFDQVHSRQVIFFACPALKEFVVKDYFQRSEKLLLIKGCDQNADYAFNLLSKNSLNQFLYRNSQFSFLQFHLPSLESKQAELNHIQNFFELVKTKQFDRQEFKTLGWTQIQWSEETNAYRPKAAVDAIEYFRLNDSEL